MFRFSIRDLLWLTLVVAMGLGWFIHQRHLRAEAMAREQQLQAEVDKAKEDVAIWKDHAEYGRLR